MDEMTSCKVCGVEVDTFNDPEPYWVQDGTRTLVVLCSSCRPRPGYHSVIEDYDEAKAERRVTRVRLVPSEGALSKEWSGLFHKKG